MEQLSTEEFHRLIVETFENRVGIELLRSILVHTPMAEEGEELEIQIANHCHGASTGDVGQYQLLMKTLGVSINPASPL